MAQDFHLAMRHYDFALGTNIEAHLPVTLSLFRLHACSLSHTLTGRGGLSHVEHCEEEDSGRVRRGDGARRALPHRVIAVVHPREMGRATASGRTAAGATIGTRGAR